MIKNAQITWAKGGQQPTVYGSVVNVLPRRTKGKYPKRKTNHYIVNKTNNMDAKLSNPLYLDSLLASNNMSPISCTSNIIDPPRKNLIEKESIMTAEVRIW
eukprot:TRINITY_DN8078_c0_g3_i2.p3 TRINITY_DN8078_c0_g3~~TRINITY_DN8078_c0_g3_i2.p3  ORF type:complete len:101 (+),score=5.95 TRINITY_DN8078_c0_g3_i2:195-497(+)